VSDPPTNFGPYLLLERIALGGMAEVFKAVKAGVGGFEQIVAIKRILPHVAEDEEFIAMFKDEAKIAVQLQHGNIAQIYSLGQEDHSFYIALEYIAGKDARALFERCRENKQTMAVAQACFIVMKVCEGLEYAHNKKDAQGRRLNIIHRDVSPPNLLVSYEGEVKLIDFGVAKAAGRASKTQAGILKGKFGYMSPEQVRGMTLDHRSDIFALGVCLWEMLTGRRLFHGDTDFATLEKVRRGDVARPSTVNAEVPLELEAIVMRALAAEVEDRYKWAGEFHDDLQRFMFDQGLFYSRKDLAAWMRQHYAKEIELEKQKAKNRPVPQPPGSRQGATKSNVPGGAPPPPPAKRGGRIPPPPPGRVASPGSTGGRSSVQTAAHRPVSAQIGSGSGAPTQASKPAPSRAGARKRSQTMVMTSAKVNLSPAAVTGPGPVLRASPAASARRTSPAASALPKPSAADRPRSPAPAYTAPAGGGSDFDWDDDELETKLFDGAGAEDIAGIGLGGAPQGGAARIGNVSSAPKIGVAAVAVTAVVPPSAKSGSGAQGMPRAPETHAMGPGAGMDGVLSAQPQISTFAGEDFGPRSPAGAVPRSNTVKIVGIVAGTVALLAVGIGFFMMKDAERVAEGAQGAIGAGVDVAVGTGGLALELFPVDATVTVDGKNQPGGSPRIVTGLVQGGHTVVVSKGRAYLPFEQTIDVYGGQTLNLPVRLQNREVTLTVVSDPVKAELTILENGQPLATETVKGGEFRYLVQRKAAAEYSVVARAKGHRDLTVPVAFEGGPAQTLSLTLVRGGVVANAAVTPPATQLAPAGAAVRPQAAEIPRARPKASVPRARPKPKGKTATLKIGTKAGLPPATIYVDGRSQGKKPVVMVKVTPGSHTVKWTWADGSSSQKVTVADGESKVVKGSK